jgi:hypothetical protein
MRVGGSMARCLGLTLVRHDRSLIRWPCQCMVQSGKIGL